MTKFVPHETTPSFHCQPYISTREVKRFPATAADVALFELKGILLNRMERFGDAVVGNAKTALNGLYNLMSGETGADNTLLMEADTPTEWDNLAAQTFRSSVYEAFDITNHSPQQIRNDLTIYPFEEPPGTIITKARHGRRQPPLFFVEKAGTPRGNPKGRQLHVFSWKNPHAVMRQINAFSPSERRTARVLLTTRTIEDDFIRAVLQHADRYTTPDTEALIGALAIEMYPNLTAFSLYAQKKGTIP